MVVLCKNCILVPSKKDLDFKSLRIAEVSYQFGTMPTQMNPNKTVPPENSSQLNPFIF